MLQVRNTLFICSAIAMCSGCAERKARAFPWATAVLVRPTPPAPQPSVAELPADIAPDFRIEPGPVSGRLFTLRPTPPKPRGQTSTAAEVPANSKTPVLVPELSPEETAAAKQQYSESTATAEKRLAMTRGRNLTPTQLDAVSKINGFMTEAREAANEGDWMRARNLAKKAQILSEDLAKSL